MRSWKKNVCASGQKRQASPRKEDCNNWPYPFIRVSSTVKRYKPDSVPSGAKSVSLGNPSERGSSRVQRADEAEQLKPANRVQRSVKLSSIEDMFPNNDFSSDLRDLPDPSLLRSKKVKGKDKSVILHYRKSHLESHLSDLHRKQCFHKFSVNNSQDHSSQDLESRSGHVPGSRLWTNTNSEPVESACTLHSAPRSFKLQPRSSYVHTISSGTATQSFDDQDQYKNFEILETISGFPWNYDLDPAVDDRPSSASFTNDIDITPRSLFDDGSSSGVVPRTTMATVVRRQVVGTVDDGVLAVASSFDQKLIDVNRSSSVQSGQSFSYLVGQPSVVHSENWNFGSNHPLSRFTPSLHQVCIPAGTRASINRQGLTSAYSSTYVQPRSYEESSFSDADMNYDNFMTPPYQDDHHFSDKLEHYQFRGSEGSESSKSSLATRQQVFENEFCFKNRYNLKENYSSNGSRRVNNRSIYLVED